MNTDTRTIDEVKTFIKRRVLIFSELSPIGGVNLNEWISGQLSICLFVNQSNSRVNLNSFNSLVVENDPR